MEEQRHFPSTSVDQSALNINTHVQERTPLLKSGARII